MESHVYRRVSLQNCGVFVLQRLTNVVAFNYVARCHSRKKQSQQRKQKEKERKELETLKRGHLANIRIVQRNLVFVTGLSPRYAKEEVCTPPVVVTCQLTYAPLAHSLSEVSRVLWAIWKDQPDHNP